MSIRRRNDILKAARRIAESVSQGGGGQGSGGYSYVEHMTAEAGQTSFALKNAINAAEVAHLVVLNGRIMRIGASYDYVLQGQSVIFAYPLVASDAVAVYYRSP